MWGPKLNDGVSRMFRSRRHKKKGEELKDVYGRGRKPESIKSPAVSMGKGELRFSRVSPGFLPRSAQELPPLPGAWLGSGEYRGIYPASEDAPARVEGQPAGAKANPALLTCRLGLPHRFSFHSSLAACLALTHGSRAGAQKSQFPASAIPPSGTPSFLSLVYISVLFLAWLQFASDAKTSSIKDMVMVRTEGAGS